jgi:hypothetical protein
VAFTLTIRERNHSWAGRSPAVTVHSTQEEAGAALLEYVQRNWDAEMGTEPPTDADEMIREYFSDVLEAFTIRESA